MTLPVTAASPWRRLLSFGIDAILVPGLTFFLVMATGIVEDAEDYTSNIWILQVLMLAVASYLLLNGITLWREGQTLGKRALDIMVVTADGTQTAPFWRLVLIRAWGFPLTFLLPIMPFTLVVAANLLPVFFGPRRCLHDWLAGTRVINKPSRST
ncbi:MAG: RDD family protein [Pseudomonadota bacterium]